MSSHCVRAPWYRGQEAVLINHTLQKKRKALICSFSQMLCCKHAHHQPFQATHGLTGWQDSCIFNNRLLGSRELLYSVLGGPTESWSSWAHGLMGENQEQLDSNVISFCPTCKLCDGKEFLFLGNVFLLCDLQSWQIGSYLMTHVE